MKVIGTLLALCVGIAIGYPFGEPETVWPIPQKNGSIVWLTEKEANSIAELTEPTYDAGVRKLDKIRYFLYTQKNVLFSQEVDMTKPETLSVSNFNPEHPTIFYMHGWGGGYWAHDNFMIRDALLRNGEDNEYNYFVGDWSVYAETVNYPLAQTRVRTAGKEIAGFIDWLNETEGLSFDDLTVIGHSLGAHVAGFVGKNVKRGTVASIIGLDPAMPMFSYDSPKKRLSSTDARYVETIQTNGGKLGFYQPIGSAAFYPNGGQKQPGCGLDLDGGCSHGRSVHYFVEAISRGQDNELIPLKCNDFEQMKKTQCVGRVRDVKLGSVDNPGRAEGVYFVPTNKKSPVGKGDPFKY